MSTQVVLQPTRVEQPTDARGRLVEVWPVLGFALLAVAMRVPFLASSLSSDEGGFLYLARHWSDGGSLYGHYWVDRPPLLIALFGLGDLFGGVVGLRLLGCVATAVTVVALGLLAHRVLGRRAAAWTAAAACLTLVTPLLGGLDVNGELLASPFVALSLLAWVTSLTTASDRRRAGLALAAGACAMAAVLVKQNFIDGFVFAAVFALAARRLRPRGVQALVGLVTGAATTLTLVLALAATRGTSPAGVFFAMYPFRIKAAGLMGHLPLTARIQHLQVLAVSWASSLAPLLVLAVVVLLLSRRLQRRPYVAPLALATVALAGYGVVSVAAGGSYWLHYLVQLAPATALSAGLLSSVRVGRLLAGLLLASTAASWALAMPHNAPASGQAVGEALHEVSRPGDSVVSLLGSPEIVESSGLTSPYRYLWSLPSRTLDPGMARLGTTLSGPHAPTWVVVRGSKTLAEIDGSLAATAFRDHYQIVNVVCGRPVFLHDGVDRAVPASTSCRRPLSPWFDHTPTEGEDR